MATGLLSRRPNPRQTANALIDFEPPPPIVKRLPLTIRWRLERPLDGTFQVVLASFGQRPLLAQLTPNFIADTEPSLRSATIPQMDLPPGSYVILAMNGTNRDSILAASQSFYFFPTASTSTSAQTDTSIQANGTNPQPSKACDVSMLTTILTPHLDIPMIVLISMTAVLTLLGVITLFITLRKSFPCRRTKDYHIDPYEAVVRFRSPDIHPFESMGSPDPTSPLPSHQQMLSPTGSLASKQRSTLSENTNSGSSGPSVIRPNSSPPPQYNAPTYYYV